MSAAQPPLTRQPLNSLATKLILFVFVSTLATALVVSWISIQSTHSYLGQQIERQYPAALANAGEAVLAWLVAGQDALEAVAADTTTRRSAPRGGADAALDDPLARALRHSKHFSALALLAGDGSLRRLEGEAAGLAPGQRVALAGVDRTVLRTLVVEAAPLLVAAAPFPVDGDGRGTLIGVFTAERIGSLLGQQRPLAGAELALVDGSGLPIASSHAGGTPGALPRELLATPGGAVRQYATASGVHVVAAARPLGLFDWQLAIEVPFEVAYEPVLSVVMRVFVVDLCIILLLSYLAYRITTAVVRPIEALSDAARRIAQGRLDLEIPEPSANDEIGLLTRTFNDMMRKLRANKLEIESTHRSLTDRNLELQRANEVLNQLSITDGLTKLHNHRYFQDALTREIKRVNRAKQPLSILLIDLDDFKSLNDRLGHAAGDELLNRVATVMSDVVRENDLLARYGGEEFVVLATDTNLLGAYKLAEKLCLAVSAQSLILGDSMRPTRVTVSIGVAEFRGNRQRFFSAADQALYRAKASGKNCVKVDDEAALEALQAAEAAR